MESPGVHRVGRQSFGTNMALCFLSMLSINTPDFLPQGLVLDLYFVETCRYLRRTGGGCFSPSVARNHPQ